MFERNGLSLDELASISLHLYNLYGPESPMAAKYGDKLLGRVTHVFKVGFRHLPAIL